MTGSLEDAIKARARALGFALAGIARPDPSRHTAAYRGWLEEGRHGDMGYMAHDDAVARRADLRATFESVRSVVVVGHPYGQDDRPGAGDDASTRYDPPGAPEDPSAGVIARYARGRDYHKVVKKKLLELLEAVRAVADAPVEGRAYVDTGPLLERELASRAGLGWFGKNTMLLSPRYGSYFFLGVLLLDLDLEPDEPFTADRCGSCSACLDACPTGALLGRDESGAPLMDARRCISYLTIEHRGPIPSELRPAIGNRVYGCDICQEVCPWNGHLAERSAEPHYAARGPGERPVGVEPSARDGSQPRPPHPGTDTPSLVELLETALDEERWDAFSRGSAIRRAGRAGFARNVCVALGNLGSAEAVPVLSAALSDPAALVRAHAAWALGRVLSDPAVAALEQGCDFVSRSSRSVK